MEFPLLEAIETEGVTFPLPLIEETVYFGESDVQPFFVTATEYTPVKLVVYVEPVEPSFHRYVPPEGAAWSVTEQLLVPCVETVAAGKVFMVTGIELDLLAEQPPTELVIRHE